MFDLLLGSGRVPPNALTGARDAGCPHAPHVAHVGVAESTRVFCGRARGRGEGGVCPGARESMESTCSDRRVRVIGICECSRVSELSSATNSRLNLNVVVLIYVVTAVPPWS